MTSPALSVRQASLVYPSSQVPVLNDASIELQAGEIACLLGASGCGKTTLLRCIAGFDKPNTGSIYLGDEIAFDEDNFLAVECRHVGMIFQDYALFPHLSVQQNIGFGLKNSTIEKTEHAAVIRDTLELLGLTEQAEQYPHQISGGQQQRVAIGRAIAPKPSLLLLDEPFSNLDLHLRERLAHDLRNLLKSQGITALMVTHDQQEAFAFADAIGVMNNGRIEQWGSADAIYHHPESNYVADFIGDGVVLTATQASFFSLPANSSGVYLLRPEQLQLDETGEYEANIASLHPQGHSILLRCLSHQGQDRVEVLIRCAAHTNVEAGSVIRFNLCA